MRDAVRRHARAESRREVPEVESARRGSALLRVIGAAGRVRAGAMRRPAADQVQVSGQGPRVDRLEHVILEDEILGVRPVIGDLAGVVVAHDVRRIPGQAHRRRRVRAGAAAGGRILGALDEPVHLAAVDVRDAVGQVVPRAAVHQARIVVGLVAALGSGIGHAHRELAVLGRDAVRPGVGAEERIERPVLLHDDDHVADLVNPGRHRGGRGDGGRRLARAAGQARHHQGGRRRGRRGGRLGATNGSGVPQLCALRWSSRGAQVSG